MPNLFSPNGNKLSVSMSEEYDPGITEEIDRQIRHMPDVILGVLKRAADLKRATGSPNFDIVIQAKPGTQRPRMYVVPINSHGIHEELSQGVLLKAALGMSGK